MPETLIKDVKIFADEDIEESILSIIKNQTDLEGAVVMLEKGPERSMLIGLDEVLQLAPTGIRVVMVSYQLESCLADDERFLVAMGYPNVCLCRLPLSPRNIIMSLKSKNRHEDILAKNLFNIPCLRNQKLIHLVQNMHSSIDDGMKSKYNNDILWKPIAREFVGNLPDEQLILAIERLADIEGREGYLANLDLTKHVCVDVDTTIMLCKTRVQYGDIMTTITKYAKTRPTILVTDKSLCRAKNWLRLKGYSYPVIPTLMLEGADVGTIISNQDPGDFFDQYGIQFLDYQQV